MAVKNAAQTFSLDVARNFTDPTWESTTQTIKYTTDYNYGGLSQEELDQQIEMINLGGASIWYQMNNKPRYW